jgi:hypothetical protein
MTSIKSTLYALSFLKYSSRDILKEILLVTPGGFRFPRNHFIFRFIDESIKNLISGGIVDHLIDYHERNCETAINENEWEPYVFKLDDLLFGFYIWLGSCAVSLTVMALEWVWFYGKGIAMGMVQSSIGLYFILCRLKLGFGL